MGPAFAQVAKYNDELAWLALRVMPKNLLRTITRGRRKPYSRPVVLVSICLNMVTIGNLEQQSEYEDSLLSSAFVRRPSTENLHADLHVVRLMGLLHLRVGLRLVFAKWRVGRFLLRNSTFLRYECYRDHLIKRGNLGQGWVGTGPGLMIAGCARGGFFAADLLWSAEWVTPHGIVLRG